MMFTLREFKAFLDAYKWLIVACVTLVGVSGALADFATSMGPPWPTSLVGRSNITSLCGMIACIFVFSHYWRRNDDGSAVGESAKAPPTERTIQRAMIAFVVCGAIYLIAFALLTFRDDKDVLHAKGLFYSEYFAEALDDSDGKASEPAIPSGVPDERHLLDRKLPLPVLLRHVGYDEQLIWSNGSIVFVQFLLLALWAAVFASLSALCGIFLIREERARQSQNATVATKKRNARSKRQESGAESSE